MKLAVKRGFLLISYLLLTICAFIELCIADSPRHYSYADYAMAEYLFLGVFVIVYSLHHIVCYFYLKKHGGIVLFQGFCATVDLLYVLYFSVFDYSFFKEWAFALIIGLRFASMLAFIRLFEVSKKNQ